MAVGVTPASSLKARRLRAGSTSAALSDATGISSSTLSRLENGKLQPTLDHLERLAAFHRCSLDALVGRSDTSVTMPAVTRDGVTFVPLARPVRGIHVFKVSVPALRPGDAPVACAHSGHTGHQWVLVLRGSLRIGLGTDSHVVRAGQTAEFDTRPEHALASADGQAVEVVMVFGPEGQRHGVADLGRRWAAAVPTAV